MIFLCEFDVHDGTSVSTLYVGTHGTRSGPNDMPANQYYSPRLSSVGRIERAMFGNGDGVSGGTTGGASQVGFGNISVLNGTPYGEDELIDHWINYAFRNVTVKSMVSFAQPFSQAVTRFVGTIEQLVSTNALEHFDLIIHDRLKDLDKPLLVNTYDGTTISGGNGTVDGDVDMTDQIKQKIWGTVHNVAAISVNHFDLVWQVSDGPVTSIIVYDGGVALTYQGDVGTLSTLFATNIALGSYITCKALGLFRLGSPAIGAVTADVVEGATAADRTAAQIVQRMIDWFQDNYPDVSVEVTDDDVDNLDDLNSAECGILVTQTESGLTAIMRVLNSIGAWILPQSDSESILNLGRFDSPDDEDDPITSYDFDDNLGGNPERIESGDDSKGVPAWKLIVKYDQIATVQQSGDLFGLVTENDPVRVQYLSQEWRQASIENEGILEVWPNAPTITVETRLLTQAAAQAEAARLFALYSVQRDIWKLTVPMSDDPQDDPGIGEIVELTSRAGRMGLGREIGSGDLFRVLGRVDDFDSVPTLALTLYGPPRVAFTPAPTVPHAWPIEAIFDGTGSLRVNATVQVATIAGLILHYKFNDTVTTDYSGNNNTGTIAGSGTTLVTGHDGNALSFNGSGYVTFTSVSLIRLATAASEISIMCWMKSTQTDNTLVSLRDTSHAIIDLVVGYNGIDNVGTGKLSLTIWGDAGSPSTVTSTVTVNDGNWHHVAFTRNSSQLCTLYIDGVNRGSGTDSLPGGLTPLQAYSSIGYEIVAGGRGISGLMDDLRIYNRALTPTEIATIVAST